MNLQLINETMVTRNDCKKSWLIKFFLKGIYNERNFIVAIRSIRSLKNTFCKHMTAISGKLYIAKLDSMVNKLYNRCHRLHKMKPLNVKSSIYFDTRVKKNNKSPKFLNLKLMIL